MSDSLEEARDAIIATRGQRYDDSELVAIPIPAGGYPLGMFAAMLEGIERRFPGTAWVTQHGFEGNVFVLHLGPRVYDDDV